MTEDQRWRIILTGAAVVIIPALWHAFALRLPRIGFIVGKSVRRMIDSLRRRAAQ